MTRDNKDLLVGLDIGTSKVVAIVAELHADGEIEVIGTGQHESNGLKKGVVVDIEKTVASIQAALEEAEITSGNKIQQVITETPHALHQKWRASQYKRCRHHPGAHSHRPPAPRPARKTPARPGQLQRHRGRHSKKHGCAHTHHPSTAKGSDLRRNCRYFAPYSDGLANLIGETGETRKCHAKLIEIGRASCRERV